MLKVIFLLKKKEKLTLGFNEILSLFVFCHDSIPTYSLPLLNLFLFIVPLFQLFLSVVPVLMMSHLWFGLHEEYSQLQFTDVLQVWSFRWRCVLDIQRRHPRKRLVSIGRLTFFNLVNEELSLFHFFPWFPHLSKNSRKDGYVFICLSENMSLVRLPL